MLLAMALLRPPVTPQAGVQMVLNPDAPGYGASAEARRQARTAEARAAYERLRLGTPIPTPHPGEKNALLREQVSGNADARRQARQGTATNWMYQQRQPAQPQQGVPPQQGMPQQRRGSPSPNIVPTAAYKEPTLLKEQQQGDAFARRSARLGYDPRIPPTHSMPASVAPPMKATTNDFALLEQPSGGAFARRSGRGRGAQYARQQLPPPMTPPVTQQHFAAQFPPKFGEPGDAPGRAAARPAAARPAAGRPAAAWPAASRPAASRPAVDSLSDTPIFQENAMLKRQVAAAEARLAAERRAAAAELRKQQVAAAAAEARAAAAESLKEKVAAAEARAAAEQRAAAVELRKQQVASAEARAAEATAESMKEKVADMEARAAGSELLMEQVAAKDDEGTTTKRRGRPPRVFHDVGDGCEAPSAGDAVMDRGDDDDDEQKIHTAPGIKVGVIIGIVISFVLVCLALLWLFSWLFSHSL